MLNRGDYRIRNSKKTQDDIDLDFEEHLKISTHIQAPKRQNSAALVRRHNESSQNSRIKESRVGSGFGSGIGSRVGRVLRMSKTAKDKNVVTDIEFNNVRWISIVSAYDSKRLRHVTVSKQSCQTFLKKYGYDLKKDPAAMAYFRDIKKHFYSWLSKINETFVHVLDQFLTISDKSPLNSLQKVGPTLEEIRSDTAMMEQKLQGCLKIYENNDFRKLSQRFKGFFVFSSSLEELIAIIFESKERIDDLFYQLQNGENVDRKIEKIKKQGMKETKKLVYHDSKYSPSLCDKIMEKVSLAINDMTTRSLDLFHKFQGAKELITKIRKILNDANKRLTIREIKKFSEIFHQVLQQTAKFQDFVEHFDSENDFVTDQLRQKIHLCRQDLLQKKKAVGQMQVIFVGTVIAQTTNVLHQNFQINNALNQQQLQYQEHNHLLQAIADIMLDQTKRTVTESLIKQNRTAFTRLQEDLEKIRRSLKKNENGLVIDTEDGQVTAMECYKLAKDYKQKVKNLVKKHEDALKNMEAKVKELRFPSTQQDPQIQFLSKLVSVSEGVNSRQRHHSLLHQKGFHQPKGDISVAAVEVQQIYSILQSLALSRSKIVELNEQNPLVLIVKQIRTQNCLYLQCSFLLNVFKLISQTSEKNLIQTLGSASEINGKRKSQLQKLPSYKQTKHYRNILQKLYCLIMVKGLKKNAVKEIDDSKLIKFPENEFQTKQMENQSKYRTLLLNTLTDQASFIRQKINLNLQILKDIVGGKRLIEKLILNQNGQFIALVDTLSSFSSQMFKLCLLKNKAQGIATEARRISLQLTKCFKTRSANIDNLERQIDLQHHDAILRVRKQIIHYKNINEKAINSCETIAKSQDNDPLSTLSTITHIIVEYIRETNQIVYFALNQFRQPIWIGPCQQAKEGIAKQIELNGYQRGNFVDSYANQPPKAYKIVKEVVVSKQKKVETKEKKNTKPSKHTDVKIRVKDRAHERQAMDEQIDIIQSENEMKEQFNEDIPDVEQQMIEQMSGGMEENIVQNQMGEEIADDMEEDIKQVSMEEHMGEQIPEDDDEVQIIKPKMQKNQKQQQTMKQKQKQMKKQEQQKPKKSVYEVIPFFRQFQEIRELIQKIKGTQRQFWKEYVDFQEIEDYFHRPQDLRDRNNFVKSLENSFAMFLGTRFGSKLGELVKNLDRLRTMKGQILSFGQKSWQQLFKILDSVERNYSVLLNHTSQVLRIFTYNGDNRQFRLQNCKKCLENYLQSNFKSTYFSLQNFDLEGYLSNCMKVQTQQLVNSDEVSFHYIVKYTAKSSDSLPTVDIGEKLAQIAQIQRLYSKQLATGISMSLLCMQFWVKATQSSSEDCYKPDYSVLDKYIKQLSKLQKKQWIGHYLIDFNKNMSALKANVKSHKNGIDNLMFKIDASNIFQCLQQLSKLYVNVTLQKLFYSDSQNKKHLIYFQRSNQVEGKYVQTNQSSLIKHLLSFKKSKQSEITLKKQNFVDQIEKLIASDNNNQQKLGFLMKLLNILKIEHFFIKNPHLFFKNSQETLVLCILKELGIKNTTQIQYQLLINDLFEKKQDTYSHQFILKNTKNVKLLSQQNIKVGRKILKQGEQQFEKSKLKFRTTIKQTDMSNVMIDCLLNKSSENNLIKILQGYNTELRQFKSKFDKNLNSKQENILFYVHSFRASVQSLLNQVNEQIIQISPMIVDSSKLSKIPVIIETVSNLFSQIKKWAKAINLSQQFTIYMVDEGQKHWIFTIQFGILKKQSKGKQLLQNLILKYWLKNNDWKSVWNFIFQKYIQKNVKIQRTARQVEVFYNFQAAVREMMTDIRLDLAQKQDVIEFAKLYNKHRFNQSQQIIDLLTKFHSQIMQRLSLKKKLLQFGKYAQLGVFEGLNRLELSTGLFECIKEDSNTTEADLDTIAAKTGELKEKETDLASFIKWYKILPQNKLGFCHYLELRSSVGVPITLLPIFKMQKDKSKNNEEIGSLLRDIQLPPTFYTKLQRGVQVVYMEPQIVQCLVRDRQGFLINDKQLQGFQPDIPDKEILILVIQQVNMEQSILQISQLTLTASVRVIISENTTKADLICGIWRIGREDYFDLKGQHIADKNQEFNAIRKKCRGLASPQQKFKDVKVGQQLKLQILGEWLKQQIKKHERKKAQKERAELQRLRQQEQQKKQAEQFLNNLYQQLQKESVPVIHMSLKDIESKKQLLQQKSDITVSGFFKKTAEKTTKIIEKLEENKSREQITRLGSITKTYLKALDEELIKNYQIQARIKETAKTKFQTILEQRQKKKKQKANYLQQKQKKRQQQIMILNQIEETVNEHKKLHRKASGLIHQQQKAKKEDSEAGKQKSSLTKNKSTKTLLQYTKEEEINKQKQGKEVDVVQLLLQYRNLENSNVESFLIEWLQYQEPKDQEYFRCLLDEFSKLPANQIQSLSKFH